MFRDDFVWGVAASAYQVEGRDENDGSGAMIWDRFIKEGHTPDGYDASVTSDHIHRYKDDYVLMNILGIRAYRFSMSWARLIPDGTGEVNQKAVSLYRDMILCMKKNGIEPYITMYHWELPQALQDKGGWLNDDIVDAFGYYAKVISENFSDICTYFITLNEPQCFVGIGHMSGWHAPGLKLPYKDVFKIAHNALKAHGQAVINLRKYAKNPIKVGYAPTCGMAYPATDSPEDIEAARKVLFGFYQPMDNWTWNVSWFSDPVFLGHYPEEGLKKFAQYLPDIRPEDMKLINQKLDFMGQNIYNGYMIRCGSDGEPERIKRPVGAPKTAAQWPVTPECIYWGVKMIYERYKLPMYITENGMSAHDDVSLDGCVHDPNRQNFLDLYISAAQRASDEGVDIRGYFLWTFLDNFEWDKGYTERFGIVYVDFPTGKRIVKDSAYWYREVIMTNGANLSINQKPRQVLFLEPLFMERPWGGHALRDDWGYDLDEKKYGECWGISAHPSGSCVVSEGIYRGISLLDMWIRYPELFNNCGQDKKERFPLLTKIIDASEDLSIQVHPDDSYANENEDGSLGKTESWYVLDAPEGASLIVGHNAKSKEELRFMIENENWDELIRKVPVKKGDLIKIKPGTVHAITSGIQVLETQENSDLTYRLYDYDRTVNGRKRELHTKKALDVITVPSEDIGAYIKHINTMPENRLNELDHGDHFSIYHLKVTDRFSLSHEKDFMLMSVIEGTGCVNGHMVKKGDHFILPYKVGEVTFAGSMTIIASAP